MTAVSRRSSSGVIRIVRGGSNVLIATIRARIHKTRRLMAMTVKMTAEQAATLKRLAREAYELDAFKPNLTRAEADERVTMLRAKLKLLGGPPHTL